MKGVKVKGICYKLVTHHPTFNFFIQYLEIPHRVATFIPAPIHFRIGIPFTSISNILIYYTRDRKNH